MSRATGTPPASDALARPAPGAGGPPLDDAAFEALLGEHLEPGYRLAYRLAGDTRDAEDLVQDAALRAFRFRTSFVAGTSFKAWFFRIIVNQFYTTVRRRRETTSLDELEDAHEIYLYTRSMAAGVLTAGGDPQAVTVSRMAEGDVGRALAALPDEFRAACTLYFVEDLSYQEIAAILEVPVGTVRSRLHRGRRMLQKRLWTLAEELGIVNAARAGATTG